MNRAIVGPRGDIAWLCAPRWDSDAVFGTMVEPGSLIWRSRWIGSDHLPAFCDTVLKSPKSLA